MFQLLYEKVHTFSSHWFSNEQDCAAPYLGVLQVAMLPIIHVFTPLAAVQEQAIVPCLIGAALQPLNGRYAQPALIGRHCVTERDSVLVQYNGIV